MFLAEAALMHVHDMPDGTTPLESPAGSVGERPTTTEDSEQPDADATSWGYRVGSASRLQQRRSAR